jgi:hypothetical protein
MDKGPNKVGLHTYGVHILYWVDMSLFWATVFWVRYLQTGGVKGLFPLGGCDNQPVFFKKVIVGENLIWRCFKRLYSHLALEWSAQAHSKFTQSEFLLFGLAEEFHGILNYMVHGPSMVV